MHCAVNLANAIDNCNVIKAADSERGADDGGAEINQTMRALNGAKQRWVVSRRGRRGGTFSSPEKRSGAKFITNC